MRASSIRAVFALAALSLLGGCDTFAPVPADELVVVEAYLVVGEPLPQVQLSQTNPIDAEYDADRLAVREARVFLHLLDGEGALERTFPYVELARRPGVYVATSGERIRPLRVYRLEVQMQDGGEISAETLVPGDFELRSANTETLSYQGRQQLVLEISSSEYIGREAIYLLTTESHEPTVENLTPVYRALVDQGTLTIDDLRVGASPLLNEANYDLTERGTLEIRLPWLAVPFYGRSTVHVNVVDDNVYDFLRSQAVQQGGSTLPPGEIPNVIDNIDGGTGVFGSYARVSHPITVLRPGG